MGRHPTGLTPFDAAQKNGTLKNFGGLGVVSLTKTQAGLALRSRLPSFAAQRDYPSEKNNS
jgi:hypothetical protein